MTLGELAAGYRYSAELLAERIRALRAETGGGCGEVQTRRMRADKLEDLRRDCMGTAAYLEHYHDGRRRE